MKTIFVVATVALLLAFGVVYVWAHCHKMIQMKMATRVKI